MSYFWVKTLHIVFVIGWCAGLICLPRIFMALAQAPTLAARAVLHGMGRRLLRFSTLLAPPAILLGLWLFGVVGIGKGANGGWLHAKAFFVFLTVVFHFTCFVVLMSFEGEKKGAGAGFCRWLGYVALALLLIIVGLAVLKPF